MFESRGSTGPDPAVLARAVPTPALIAALAAMTPHAMSDAQLVEVAGAWERVSSFVAARQSAVIDELRSRRVGIDAELVGDEIAPALGLTRRAAELRVEMSRELAHSPEVHAALERGAIDVRKASLLVDEVLTLPVSLRGPAQLAALEYASQATAPQLRRHLRRITLTIDPADAEKRAGAQARQRHVLLEPAADSMAWLNAYLPATEASAAFGAIDALAHAQAPHDDRTLDQRRADAFVGVFSAILDSGRALVPDRSTGSLVAGSHAVGSPAVGSPAVGSPAVGSPAVGTPAVEGPAADGPAAVRATKSDGAGRRVAWCSLPTVQRRRPHLEVAVAATTLLGLDDAPAALAGYGPIPASLAREIAADATWRGVLTDPVTGSVAARGERAYRPSAALAGLVVSRDVTCRFPGCQVPAARCDLDHIVPFDDDRPAQDQTHADNLQALCRHHHRLKTFGRWTVDRDPVSGATAWVSPSARRYVRDAEPALGPPLSAKPGRNRTAHLEPPAEPPAGPPADQAVNQAVNQAVEQAVPPPF